MVGRRLELGALSAFSLCCFLFVRVGIVLGFCSLNFLSIEWEHDEKSHDDFSTLNTWYYGFSSLPSLSLQDLPM